MISTSCDGHYALRKSTTKSPENRPQQTLKTATTQISEMDSTFEGTKRHRATQIQPSD